MTLGPPLSLHCNALRCTTEQESHGSQAVRHERAGATTTEMPTAVPRAQRPTSRPARILAVIEEVRSLVDGYQKWRDGMPANFSEGQMADRLDQVIAELEEVAAALEQIDPPTVGR